MKQVEASVASWVNTTFTAQMLKLKYDAPTHLEGSLVLVRQIVITDRQGELFRPI
jgi:hypothetical protein